MATHKAEKKGLKMPLGKVQNHIGKLPTKRRMNLATVGVKPFKTSIAIPAIILIIVLAILFSKFAVFDRLMKLDAAWKEVAEKQAILDQNYEKIQSFGSIKNQYAHYTYSGMTAEELQRADRSNIMKLIDEKVIPFATVSEWSVDGNVMSLTMSAQTLQIINTIVADLERDEMVDFCSVKTAKTEEFKSKSGDKEVAYEVVTGEVTIYLNPQVEGGSDS